MDNPKVKTLELLKDWSTWLVAIDTGALALLGSLSDWHQIQAKILAAAGSIGFLISLIAASYLVGAVPVLVQRVLVPEIVDTEAIQVSGKISIYQFKYGPMRIETYAVLQHYSFVLAALLITVAFIVEML